MTLEEALKKFASSRNPSDREVPDDEIDLSDIPELTDEELGRMRLATEFREERRALRRAGRPLPGNEPRKPISIKLDPALIEGLKREAARQGTKYQSLIHRILADHLAGNGR